MADMNMLLAVGRKLGVNLFSAEFLREQHHMRNRCYGRVIGGKILNGQSLLRAVLHAGLTEEDRMRMFPCTFDLGNARSIPEEACTFEALLEELEQQRPPEISRENPLDKTAVVRLLKDTAAILEHTPPQERQAGAGQFFKVAKLLHEFKERKPGLLQIKSILRPPTEATASLELFNPYPTGADSDVRQLIIDLQGRLSAEISSKRLAEIDGTFGLVRPALDEAINSIERELKTTGRPSPDEIVQRYAVVLKQWTPRCRPPARQVLPADEQLYVAMHALDFLHFAEVERNLRREKLLQRHIVPVSVGLHAGIRLDDLRARPITDSVQQLRRLLSMAVGEEITPRQFRSYLESAHTILKHWVSLQEFPAPEDVDALTGLAAIVVARELREQSPSYKPGLYGVAHGQSHSVKASVKIGRSASSTHEEFERIVNYAIRWVRYALSGQTAVIEAQVALQMQLIDGAISVLNTHNTDVVATFLSNLQEYANYGVKHVPHLVASGNLSSQRVPTQNSAVLIKSRRPESE